MYVQVKRNQGPACHGGWRLPKGKENRDGSLSRWPAAMHMQERRGQRPQTDSVLRPHEKHGQRPYMGSTKAASGLTRRPTVHGHNRQGQRPRDE